MHTQDFGARMSEGTSLLFDAIKTTRMIDIMMKEHAKKREATKKLETGTTTKHIAGDAAKQADGSGSPSGETGCMHNVSVCLSVCLSVTLCIYMFRYYRYIDIVAKW